MHISDNDLVQRCKDGDREAFNTLIKRYQHAVYGLCYHFAGDFAEAQDLAQETFVRIYLDLHQILVAKKIIDEQLFRQSQDSCDEGSESASEKK